MLVDIAFVMQNKLIFSSRNLFLKKNIYLTRLHVCFETKNTSFYKFFVSIMMVFILIRNAKLRTTTVRHSPNKKNDEKRRIHL